MKCDTSIKKFPLLKSFLTKTIRYFKISSLALLVAPLFCTPAMAQNEPIPCPWIFTGSVGYATFLDMYKNDGQTAVGRIAIGKEFYKTDEMAFGSELSFGLELGLQTGNRMRLDASQAVLDEIDGGLPIQTTIKPMLDLLFTLRTNTLENFPIFMQIKIGGMYRQWQFDESDIIDTESRFSPELQFGLGYLINEHAFATLSYQGVYGGNPTFTVNRTDLFHITGKVDNIPSQNAILLGFSLTV